MFKLINTFNNYSFRVLKNLIPSYVGMLRVKAGRPLVNHLLKMVLLVKGSIETSLVKVIVSYVRFLHRLHKANGSAFTAKYLKASVSLLMQALSGEKHNSTRVLGLAVSRTGRGLPRFIPAVHRKHIKEGNLFYIRLWLSLISIYRVLDFTGKLSLKTIISGSKASINYSEVMFAVQSLNVGQHFDLPKITMLKSFWIGSSSPTSTKKYSLKGTDWKDQPDVQGTYSTAFAALLLNLHGLFNNLSTMESYLKYAEIMGHKGHIIDMVKYLLDMALNGEQKRALEHTLPPTIHIGDAINIKADNFSRLGKLAFKIEPAGKIRVFAMADAFTQWLLKPLHDRLFNFLRSLKSDATFDQTKIVDDFNKRLVSLGIRKVYSFDLTAATDRIPVDVQAFILDILHQKEGLGDAWKSLLVERWYHLPFPQWDPMCISRMLTKEFCEAFKDNILIDKVEWAGKKVPYIKAIKYSTGQPMGAYSSWAMLAVTHHVMVRIAAIRAGYSKFDLYLVLGDDLVIADSNVANHYLNLAKEWDIEINLSKSVLSKNGSFEFAKRFFYKGNDVSGLSFKEMAVAYWDLRALFQLLNRIKRFRTIRVSEMLSFMGHGYKALSRINAKLHQMGTGMRKSLLLASFPTSMFSKINTVTDWLIQNRFNQPTSIAFSSDSLKVFKDYLLKSVQTIKPSSLPADTIKAKHAILELMPSEIQGIICYNNMPGLGVRSISDLLSFICWPMLFDIHSSNKRLETSVIRCSQSIQMKSDVLEIVWEGIETLEDKISLISNHSQFRVVKDVQTLGKSKLLKRAEFIRSTITSFSKESKRSSTKRR